MNRDLIPRRAWLGGGAALATGVALGGGGLLLARDARGGSRAGLVAKPPAGFVPLSLPGKVVRIDRANTLRDNGLWPHQEAATAMLERAMAELTGKSDLGEAFAKIVHKDDLVAIKPNGIAGQVGASMASNKELVLAVVRGVIAAGVPAENITIFEQYPKFLAGTRVVDKDQKLDKDFPAGIKTSVHENKDATMDEIEVASKKTRFVRQLTEATCVINVGQIKDHSICGYTGAMKNITHGAIVNPHDFHKHNASPQIAQLYAQDIVKSRVRLHISDAFKITYDGGPLDRGAKRVPFEAVFASTDPVALDVIGWQIVEQHRKDKGLVSLKDDGRDPLYIKAAADLGLGVFDKNQIRLRQVKI